MALKLGVIVSLAEGPEAAIENVAAFDLPSCQVSCWNVDLYTDTNAARLRGAADAARVQITTLWAGWPGRKVWNFVEGPTTIGVVPPETRAERILALKRGADFARAVGVPSITTHVGFIPENPSDTLYHEVVEALRDVAGYCRDRGLQFWFETGQETPITLLRVVEDVGTGNLGINLDPANLLMYGKANPVDALDVIGHLVRGVHAKDGEYPTNGRELGVEKPLGEGRVNFPALIPKLRSHGFNGALTIEREIRGTQQAADIKRAIELLRPLCDD